MSDTKKQQARTMTPVSRAVLQHPLHDGMFVIFEPHHASLIVRDSDSYGLVIEQRVQGTRTGRIQQERLQRNSSTFPEGPETRQYRKKPEKGRVLGRLRLRKRGR